MLFGGWVGFSFSFIMGFDGERASDVGLQTQPVSNETASDQKAAWLSCNTIFSNCHRVSIAVIDRRVSLGKPRAIILYLGCGRNWSVALLVLKIPKQTHSDGVYYFPWCTSQQTQAGQSGRVCSCSMKLSSVHNVTATFMALLPESFLLLA